MAAERPARPVLVYDGDCGFCTSSVRVLEKLVPGRYEVTAWQDADLASLGLDEQACQRAVQWVEPSGRRREGAPAFAEVLRKGRGAWPALGLLLALPPISWLAGLIYTLVAANRHRLPGGTPACRLPPERRPGARPG